MHVPNMHMHMSQVHVDPFGSCAPYLDTIASRSPHGGVISLTATDVAALFGLYPAVCKRIYGAEVQI